MPNKIRHCSMTVAVEANACAEVPIMYLACCHIHRDETEDVGGSDRDALSIEIDDGLRIPQRRDNTKGLKEKFSEILLTPDDS